MTKTIEVHAITLLTKRNGVDILGLHTSLPDGCWPYTGEADLTLTVAHGRGVDYCAEHFPGIPVEIVLCGS